LCSKNNEKDALEVFEQHPESILRLDNFSTWQINWNDKVTNIKHIAEDLNIGIDSLVFVDDSQFECDFVRHNLPEVAVINLSGDPSGYKNLLSEGAYFDSLSFSQEDRKRNMMYRAQVKRKELSAYSNSLEDYLSKLNMKAEISLANEKTIPRISQLTQKTNQFNLTTKRYTEGEIKTFAENKDSDVFYLKLVDKISELGIVGVVILKYENDNALIDTFLMSCRVIGRDVEKSLLAYVLNHCKAKNIITVQGEYIPTKKNNMVADFYQKQNFKLINYHAQKTSLTITLTNKQFYGPEWVKINPETFNDIL